MRNQQVTRHSAINTILASATAMTREGVSDPSQLSGAGQREYLANRKPYRTAAQKAEARRTAERCNDGVWRSSAPVSLHR